MTAGPLAVGFDDVDSTPGAGRLSVTLGPWNRCRPVWTYWFPLLCALFPRSMRAEPVSLLASRRTPFVYPVELRFEADEWCASTPADQPLAVLPPPVDRMCDVGRMVVVLSIAHEGRPLFEPDGPDRSDVDRRPTLLDRVAAFGRRYRLPPERLWFLSGNLDGDRDVEAWRCARGLTGLPFTFRACEPFSAFVGGCTNQVLRHRRTPVAATAFEREGPHAVGWRSTTVDWTPLDFPGVRPGRPVPPPRFRYACLNRMFRPHRWEVLNQLWLAGVLDRGLVSFPRPTLEEMRFAGVDAGSAGARELLQLLPLTVDRPARFDDAAFFSDNAAFVGLHPPEVLRDCALELVTETRQEGCRFVSEKTFKALLGRGPAAIVGTRGVLSYLHSLGVRTWPDQVPERYDDLPDAHLRLTAAVDAALGFVSRTDTDAPGIDEAREANLRWLVSAPKPWDRLVGELSDAVHGLG